MENHTDTFPASVAQRAVAMGLAFATTTFIATSVAVVFTGSTQAFSAQVVRAVATPVRALLGG